SHDRQSPRPRRGDGRWAAPWTSQRRWGSRAAATARGSPMSELGADHGVIDRQGRASIPGNLERCWALFVAIVKTSPGPAARIVYAARIASPSSAAGWAVVNLRLESPLGSRSRAGGFHFLSSTWGFEKRTERTDSPASEAVRTECIAGRSHAPTRCQCSWIVSVDCSRPVAASQYWTT